MVKVSGIGLRFVAVILSGTVLPLAAGMAQTQPGFDETEAARQKRLLEEQERAGSASQEVLPAAEDISYADVLKDPDNVDLNFRYAKAQVARGNVRGAASTLERILLVTPDLPQIRLMYAIVLFRLDNIDEAEREFNALKELNMAASLEAEIDRFLGAIKKRRQTTTARVQVAVGVKRDSNVNAGPRSGQALGAGLLFAPTGRARKQDDFAALGVITADVTQDLGHQAPDKFLFSATYFHNEQMSIDQQDLQSGSASVALRLNYENFMMTPKLSYTTLRLSREKFYTSWGADVQFDRRNVLPNFGGIDGHFRLGVKDERFRVISENALGPERDGQRVEAEFGLKKQINPTHSLSGAALYTRKLPYDKSFNGFRGHKVSLQHTWLLGEGQFLLTGLEYATNLYKEPDPSVTAFQTRHDTQVRFRVTYGAPLGNFLSEAHFGTEASKKYYDFLKDWTWTVTGEVLDQGSNLPNFSYQNRRAQTMLTRSWDF
ncbi:MAG: tetratricopeptide repeat protein [Alphaproteobacteria bacterium]